MNTLVFDAGPIISLTMNNLLWILEELKKKSNVEFVIPQGVKKELVDNPLRTKRFKFEALQVQQLIDSGVLGVIRDKEVTQKGKELLDCGNSIFSAHGKNIQIVQIGEMETIAAAKLYKAEAIFIDERVTRTLIENPHGLQKLMERRLHMQLKLDGKKLNQLGELTKGISILRSVELVTIAYEKGLLDKYVVKLPGARKELLESILWGVKLDGASVTAEEIKEIIKAEKV